MDSALQPYDRQGLVVSSQEQEIALKRMKDWFTLRSPVTHEFFGEVRERPNRAVSKTAVPVTGPWVQIPPSPPHSIET